MSIKQFAAMILCVLAVAATVASCAGGDTQKNSADDAQNEKTTEKSGEDEKKAEIDIGYLYGGEQFDFGGETFKILYPEWSLYIDYYFAEEENGDAVNDALYRRIADTEDFFGIDIQTRMPGNIDTIAPEMKKTVLAGDNAFDIALTHCVSGLDAMVAGNYVYNWTAMPNVDFSKKYWNSSMNEYLTINGYMPFAANNFIIPDPCFITFSKELQREYALDDPYELVRAGKWTWDKLGEMAKRVSKDLDGDAQYTEADLYGFVGELDWQFINVMYACDQRLMKAGEDGRYVLDINTAKTQNIVEKLNDLLYVGSQAFTYVYNARNTGQAYLPFDSGRALFYMNQPGYVTELRATEFDFGILPYPKLDENQANYVTLNWAGTICAPVNIDNPAKVGAVVEYLGAKSREIVLPAYFDILLTGKVTRDDESQEMLDIIYGESIYDFGLNFSAFNELLYVVPKLLQAKSTDLASFYEKRAQSVQKNYDKVYEAFIANSEK